MPEPNERPNFGQTLTQTIGSLIPIAGPVIGALGSIWGAKKQRTDSQNDIQAMNEYNRPINQLARLREAGLPFAAFANNQAGNQSATPETNQGGLPEATAQLGSFIQLAMQRKQLEILNEELRIKRADADIREDDRDWKVEDSPFGVGSEAGGKWRSNQQIQMSLERDMKNAERIMQDSDYQLKAWENMARTQFAKEGKLTQQLEASLEQILAHNRIWNQQFDSIEQDRKAKDVLINELSKNGMNFWEALLFTLSSGGAQVPFIGR